MVRFRMLAAALLAIGASASAQTRPPVAPVVMVDPAPPVTILISIDGFRADYLGRGITPRLSALAAEGVSAAMRPSFPSKTFPNHWTLVTGLVPDHHGIVANKMEDAARAGETFTMDTDDPFWWNDATPLWVDAEQAGIRSATMFWPGSNVAVGGLKHKVHGWDQIDGGVRPEDWQQFNQQLNGPQRVMAVIDWLRRPAAIRPRFVTLYFDTVDTAGHRYGPDAAETNAAITDIDTTIGQLVDGIAQLGQTANLVIVADHGMAPLSRERVIPLDRIAKPKWYRVLESGPYASLYPAKGKARALEKALLRPHDHMQCWRKAEIPARFRYGTNPRIPPYFCLAETDWLIVKTTPKPDADGDLGNHGFDNQSPEMAALFIAQGPAFRRGMTLQPFDNTDIAPLVRDVLGLPAKPGDGDDAPFRGVLTGRK